MRLLLGMILGAALMIAGAYVSDFTRDRSGSHVDPNHTATHDGELGRRRRQLEALPEPSPK